MRVAESCEASSNARGRPSASEFSTTTALARGRPASRLSGERRNPFDTGTRLRAADEGRQSDDPIPRPFRESQEHRRRYYSAAKSVPAIRLFDDIHDVEFVAGQDIGDIARAQDQHHTTSSMSGRCHSSATSAPKFSATQASE